MIQKFLSIALISTLLLFACSKNGDSSDNNLSNTPQAKAEFDNSNYGIYKGVFVGSSGTVSINIFNNNTVTATLKIDGVTYDFTTSQTVQINQPTSINFFSSGTNAFTFTAAGNGANPTVTNIVLPGHPNAVITILKEKSNELVKVYEGTYKESVAGGETGTFNIQVRTSTVVGAFKEINGAFPPYPMSGTVANNQMTGTSPAPTIVPPGGAPGTTVQGSFSGDEVSGTFTNVYGGGTWTGKRTL